MALFLHLVFVATVGLSCYCWGYVHATNHARARAIVQARYWAKQMSFLYKALGEKAKQ